MQERQDEVGHTGAAAACAGYLEEAHLAIEGMCDSDGHLPAELSGQQQQAIWKAEEYISKALGILQAYAYLPGKDTSTAEDDESQSTYVH